MSHSSSEIGAVLSLWRYPVKSMMGEELMTAEVQEHGVAGDRVYALIAEADGKVVSAKNPGKWPNLFAFRAGVEKQSENGEGVLPIRITLPDGTTLTSEQRDVDRALSKALGKNVVLAVTERGNVAGVQSSMPAGWSARAVQYNDGHVGVYAAVVQEGVIKRGDPVRVCD